MRLKKDSKPLILSRSTLIKILLDYVNKETLLENVAGMYFLKLSQSCFDYIIISLYATYMQPNF